ncbi:MAG: hypothetical protein KAY37_07950 [Phycisphaerae bacterium]|nr:hypothetical protein [Phycisphaerae bacterium]
MRTNLFPSFAGLLVVSLVLLGTPLPAGAQAVDVELVTAPVRVDSGPVENTGEGPDVVYSTTIHIPDAPWLRLKFEDIQLMGEVGSGTESYLLITSQHDGAYQYANAVHIAQWRKTSAYFNGGTVTIDLIAYPGTGPNLLKMSEVYIDEIGEGDRSICGPTDDRVLSYDARAGRLEPGGCSTWMIDDCNHCFLTAGHCIPTRDTVEFNVPLSDPDGSKNHPPPEDQYPIDQSSIQSNGGQGTGNDWAYFGCFANSNTGLTPAEAQGNWFILDTPPPVSGQSIRITGYGTVDSPVSPTWNQVQKTHVGPFVTSSGTLVQYQTDTTGGNSGSPVILEETDHAIGIHTHGGCGISSGENSGTGANHSGLQTALANPLGVCICIHGLKVTPTSDFASSGDPGGPFSPTTMIYTLENLEDTGFNYLATKNEDWITLTNTSGYLPGYASTQVTVEINDNANSLGVGEHTDILNFINTTTHDGDTTRNVILTVGGPQPVYVWDMSTNPGWSTEGLWAYGQPNGGGGQYGGPDPTSGYTGNNVYGYNLNGDYENNLPERHLTTAPIDCSELQVVTLKFRRWLGVESPTYDHAYLRISTNGSSWDTVWENTFETTDYAWSPQEFDISDWADGEDTVYLRWTMGITDTAWQYCGWNIDDVEIWGLVVGPPTGACCQPDGSCTVELQEDCTGSYFGDGTDCSPNPCPQPSGACCLPDGTCIVTTQADCSGTWLGAGIGCYPNPCTPPVCPGDSNCDGAIGWPDIDFFVAAMNDDIAAWEDMFAPGAPTCDFSNNDVNADGTVNWRDIDPLVALMNTTCP